MGSDDGEIWERFGFGDGFLWAQKIKPRDAETLGDLVYFICLEAERSSPKSFARVLPLPKYL